MPNALVKNDLQRTVYCMERTELFHIFFLRHPANFMFNSEFESECECESEYETVKPTVVVCALGEQIDSLDPPR